jgi:hypothetical protein
LSDDGAERFVDAAVQCAETSAAASTAAADVLRKGVRIRFTGWDLMHVARQLWRET